MFNLKLSVSKCKTFSDCKKKYNYVYNLKFPRKEFEYHTFGKFCHKVLEDFHLDYINGSTEPFNKVMSTAFKNTFEEYKEKMTPEMKKECWVIIDKYLRNISKNKKFGTNVIACEKNFDFNIADNIILNGMIDRIQVDDDNVIHVADYKTTKNKKYLKDDWFQLQTYAYVIHQENPDIKKVRASYILLRHDFEYITKEFNIDEILSIEDINMEKEYPANPTQLCRFCEYSEICSEGKDKTYPQNTYGEVNW
jgi:RecB family exonuclease